MNCSYTKFPIILFFIAVHLAQLSAQPTLVTAPVTNIRFDQIGLEQGLSQSTVYAIVQDKQGFMWFGTQDGLNRYDGYSIKVFKHDPDDTNSISNNGVWSLLCDNNGDLWIRTLGGGVDRYSVSKNIFYHYNHIGNDSEIYVTTLFEDSHGNVWLGTRNKGLYQYDKSTDTFNHIQFEEKRINYLTDYSIRAICEDSSGNLWIGTDKGLIKTKIEGNRSIPNLTYIYRHSAADTTSLSSNNIRSLYVDSKGTLWTASLDGINRFEEKANTFRRYTDKTGSITSDFIKALCEDAEGRLWTAAFGNGLHIYDKISDNFIPFSSDLVLTMYKDRTDILWIGTFAYGIKTYDIRKNYFSHYFNNTNKANDLKGNIVTAILEVQGGDIWVGTFGNGLNRLDNNKKSIIKYFYDPKDNNSLSNDFVCALNESIDGNIWVGTRNGLNVFNKKNKKFISYKHNPNNSNSLSNNSITTLYCDKQKNLLWIGYYSGEVDCFDILRNKFTKIISAEEFSNKPVSVIYGNKYNGVWIGAYGGKIIHFNSDFNNSGLLAYSPESYQLSDNIFSIYEDNEGTVWIGTNGGGLVHYNPKDNSFTYYKEEQGLPNNTIYGILPDNRGYLWLSTNKCISKFNPKTKTCQNYDRNDGLQGNEFNQGAYFRNAKGELFFGGVNGINSFFPDEIEANNYIPSVYVTNFKVFNEILPLQNPIPTNSEISLSYSQNFFSFEFVALNFTAPEKNQYAYMLDGFDKDWHYVPAEQRYASYTNLDPGKYILHVKGSNNDGVWNEIGTSVSIIITPPFWMTWWFRILLIVFFIGIVILIYNYRVQQLLKIERIRFQIATDLHDDIGTSLTGIALYSDLAKQEIKEKTSQAIERLDRIAQFSRSMLDQMNDIVWFIRPENDSLQSAILRISDYANTLFEAKGIEYHTNIRGEIKDIKLSMEQRRNILLIFKEMVNNVLKHSRATEVKIDLITEKNPGGKEGMAISVSDNGCGFDLDNVIKGNGINSMKSRAASIGAEMDINPIICKGTQLKLFVPFKIT